MIKSWEFTGQYYKNKVFCRCNPVILWWSYPVILVSGEWNPCKIPKINIECLFAGVIINIRL